MRLWDGNWRELFPGWKYWWQFRLYSRNGIKLHSVQFQIICWLFYSSNDNNVILQSVQYKFLQNYSRIKDPSCKKIYIKINLMLRNIWFPGKYFNRKNRTWLCVQRKLLQIRRGVQSFPWRRRQFGE